MRDLLTNTGTHRDRRHALGTRTRSGDTDTLGGHGLARGTRTRSRDTDTLEDTDKLRETDTLRGQGNAQGTRTRSGDTDTLEDTDKLRDTDTLEGHGHVEGHENGHGHGTVRSRSRHGRNTKKLQTRNYYCIKIKMIDFIFSEKQENLIQLIKAIFDII